MYRKFDVMNRFFFYHLSWFEFMQRQELFLTSTDKTEIFLTTFSVVLSFLHFERTHRMKHETHMPVWIHFLYRKDQKLGKTVWRKVAPICATRVTATDTAVLPAVRTHLIVLPEILASAVPVQTSLSTWQSIHEPSLCTGCS